MVRNDVLRFQDPVNTRENYAMQSYVLIIVDLTEQVYFLNF